MIISTERLTMRPFGIEHLNEFYNILQEDKILKYLPGVYSSNIEEVKENIEIYQNGDFINDFYFVIESKKDKSIVGGLICVRTTSNVYDMSYFIKKSQRRQGYMYEALNAFCNALKANNKQVTIYFTVRRDNYESLALVRKIGATLVLQDSNYLKFIY